MCNTFLIFDPTKKWSWNHTWTAAVFTGWLPGHTPRIKYKYWLIGAPNYGLQPVVMVIFFHTVGLCNGSWSISGIHVLARGPIMYMAANINHLCSKISRNCRIGFHLSKIWWFVVCWISIYFEFIWIFLHWHWLCLAANILLPDIVAWLEIV